MVKHLTLLFLAISLALGMFVLTLHELRNWKLAEPEPAELVIPEPTRSVDTLVLQTPPAEVIQVPVLELGRQNAITRAIVGVSDAVVGITVTQIRYTASPYMSDPFWRFMMPELPKWFAERVQSLGSGVIYDRNGYIITNAHVVHNAETITVTLAGGRQVEAELMGIDEKTDLALIHLVQGEDYPFAPLGDSDDILIGEWVIALGNPFGLLSESRTPIATAGIISSLHMDFGIQRSGRVYQDMIQTDASINSGNSGGPLVNALGQVIGINTFIFTGNNASSGSIGIGFAIPVNRCMEIINELREKGFIDRRYTTGLTIRNIDANIARMFRLEFQDGVIVWDVERDSPADKAGILVGDVILGLEGNKIRNDRDITTYIRSEDLRSGDSLKLNIWREGHQAEITVILEG